MPETRALSEITREIVEEAKARWSDAMNYS